MKFTIQNDIFIQNLQKINRLLIKNVSSPILENILLEINDGTLSLTATNLDIELIANIDIKNKYTSGKTTISGRKILDICRNSSKNSNITIELKNEKIHIQSKNSKYTLTTLPAENFPKNQNFNHISEFFIYSNILKNMIDKTEFSMGKQDVRYYLNGMLLEKEGTLLRSVATDGYRLAMSNTALEKNIVSFSIIIPRKGILELSRLLNITSTLIRVLIGQNNIKIYINKLIFTAQLLEGKYPDYHSVLFQQPKQAIIINSISLKKSLSRVSILSHEKFCGVEMHFNDEQLKVLSNNQEDEKAEDQFIIKYFGKKIEFSINAYYLLDILNVINSENIFLFINESKSSIQIQSEKNSSEIYIVMLLRR